MINILICDLCGNEIDNKINFVFIENYIENNIHGSLKKHLCLQCGNDIREMINKYIPKNER